MQYATHGLSSSLACAAGAIVMIVGAPGCSTAPEPRDRETFVSESRAATRWFENNVLGMRAQIEESAGYIVFPSVGQFGLVFGGGRFGRGVVNTNADVQLGWAAVDSASIGLQAGAQGFKMLVLFEDDATFRRYQEGKLAGSATAVAIAGEAGRSGTAPFVDGVVVYQGDNTGLMAGVNIGLDYLRYEPLDGD